MNWKQLRILDVTSRDSYMECHDCGFILQDCVQDWQIASFGSQIQTIKASTLSDGLHVLMCVSYSVTRRSTDI